MTLSPSPANKVDSHHNAAIHIAAIHIAAIHTAAFTNALLDAKCPTPSAREALELCIARKALADIRDPKIALLIMRDHDAEIISFAKWSLPIFDSETDVESFWIWLYEINFASLDA